jgi:hypothetical protein
LIASEISISPDITPYGSNKTVHQALSTLATNLSVSGTLVSINDASAASTTVLWSSNKVKSELDALGSEIATSILPPVANVTALKAIDTTGLADKVLIFSEDKGLYRFDEDSTATGDDDGVVDPTTGPGRWIKMSSTSAHNAVTIATGSTNYLSLTSSTQELNFSKYDLLSGSGTANQIAYFPTTSTRMNSIRINQRRRRVKRRTRRRKRRTVRVRVMETRRMWCRL